MATEYGVFDAEDCLAPGFWSHEEAESAAASYRAQGTDAVVSPICSRHRDALTRADTCQQCTCEDGRAALVVNGKLVCPYRNCGAINEIIELDVATRTNELEITEPGVVQAYLGDSRFESDGFECRKCEGPVVLPDGYQLQHD